MRPAPAAEPSADRARELLHSHFPVLEVAGAPPLVIKGPLVRDYSRIFWAQGGGLLFPVGVKWCLIPTTLTPNPTEAAQQFDALQRVSRVMHSDSDFSVPRPVLLEPAEAVIAMEWVAGTGMNEYLLSWTCTRRRALEMVTRAGDWLRSLHGFHPLPSGALELKPRLEYIAQLETSSHLMRDPDFTAAIGVLKRTANAAAAVLVPRSWMHGDFKSDNLLIDGRRTVGIDLHLTHENMVVFDIATFLNHLDLLLWHPRGWRLILWRDRLGETFLRRSVSGNSQGILLPLTWIRLYMLVCSWTSLDTGAPMGLRSRVGLWCLRYVVRKLKRELSMW